MRQALKLLFAATVGIFLASPLRAADPGEKS